uniref:Tudor domain-containing protein n=2 Tax=Lotharella globosa TaxID=91324 RepID=A0A7S4DRW4_9EUKA
MWFCPRMEHFISSKSFTLPEAKERLELGKSLDTLEDRIKDEIQSEEFLKKELRELEAKIEDMEAGMNGSHEDMEEDDIEQLHEWEMSIVKLRCALKAKTKTIRSLRQQRDSATKDLQGRKPFTPAWINVSQLWELGAVAVVEPDRWTLLALIPPSMTPKGIPCHPLMNIHSWVSPFRADLPRRTEKKLKVAEKVSVNYKDRGTWYKGRISEIQRNGLCKIVYDDGEVEDEVPPHRVEIIQENKKPQIKNNVLGPFSSSKIRLGYLRSTLRSVLDHIRALEMKNATAIDSVCNCVSDGDTNGLDDSLDDSDLLNLKALTLEKISIRQRRIATLEKLNNCEAWSRNTVELGGCLNIRFLPVNDTLFVSFCSYKKNERFTVFKLGSNMSPAESICQARTHLCSPAPPSLCLPIVSEALEEWIVAHEQLQRLWMEAE